MAKSDRQLVEELKAFVQEQGCTFFETDEFDSASRNTTYNFVICWEDGVVDYLFINDYHGPEPVVMHDLKVHFMVDLNNYTSTLSWLASQSLLENLYLTNASYEPPVPDLRELPIKAILSDSNVPDAFLQINSLEEINFTMGTDIILPDWIGTLPHLKKLVLNLATVKSIPYSLVESGLEFVLENDPSTDGIKLFGTTLIEGDITLFQQPRDVILAYYHQGLQAVNRECKVIFLGDGEAGKSSLIDRIIDDEFDKDKPPTEGIRIKMLPVTLGGETVRLRILDFGGQEIMHSMHRCFLTDKTVYVVVCESRDDSDIDDTAARWLKNIDNFAKGCPVILALNKADLNEHVSVNRRNLEKVNGALCAVLQTSAKWNRKKGTAPLLEAVKRQAADIVRDMTFNQDMLGIKRALESMEEPYISDAQYRALCARHNITDEALQNNLLGWFKTLGVSYYYTSNALDTRLTGLRVLSPEWLTNGMYRLILRTPEDGILSHKKIKSTLKAADPKDIRPQIEYTEEETEYILHVMRDFEISHDIGDGREFIPMKMGKTPPDSVNMFERPTALHLCWQGEYLPANLLHKLMLRKFGELDKSCMWRTGARFVSRSGNNSALVELDRSGLSVFVQGQHDRRVYMEDLRGHIMAILDDLGIACEEMVYCTENGKTGCVPYVDVLKQYRDGKEEIYISSIKEYTDPRALLHEVRTKKQLSIDQNAYARTTLDDRLRYEFYNSTVAIVRDGVAVAGEHNTVAVEQLGPVIRSRNYVEQEEFDKLVEGLAQLAKDKRIPWWRRRKMQRVARRCRDKTATSTWGTLREYLGDAANLATIATFGAELFRVLSGIFTGTPVS